MHCMSCISHVTSVVMIVNYYAYLEVTVLIWYKWPAVTVATLTLLIGLCNIVFGVGIGSNYCNETGYEMENCIDYSGYGACLIVGGSLSVVASLLVFVGAPTDRPKMLLSFVVDMTLIAALCFFLGFWIVFHNDVEYRGYYAAASFCLGVVYCYFVEIMRRCRSMMLIHRIQMRTRVLVPFVAPQGTSAVTFTTASGIYPVPGANSQHPASAPFQQPIGFQPSLPYPINLSQPTNIYQPQNVYPATSYQSQPGYNPSFNPNFQQTYSPPLSPAYNPPIAYNSGPQPSYNPAFQP